MQIHHLVSPFYKSGKWIFFILMPVTRCQLLALHLAHTTTVLNSSIILWAALLSTGNVLATWFWTEDHLVRDELFLQVQLSGSEQFAVYFRALEAWWVSWCHPPDSSPARIPVGGMKNHFKGPLLSIRRSFSHWCVKPPGPNFVQLLFQKQEPLAKWQRARNWDPNFVPTPGRCFRKLAWEPSRV